MRVVINYTNNSSLEINDVIRLKYHSYIMDNCYNDFTDAWIIIFKDNEVIKINKDNVSYISEYEN